MVSVINGISNAIGSDQHWSFSRICKLAFIVTGLFGSVIACGSQRDESSAVVPYDFSARQIQNFSSENESSVLPHYHARRLHHTTRWPDWMYVDQADSYKQSVNEVLPDTLNLHPDKRPKALSLISGVEIRGYYLDVLDPKRDMNLNFYKKLNEIYDLKLSVINGVFSIWNMIAEQTKKFGSIQLVTIHAHGTPSLMYLGTSESDDLWPELTKDRNLKWCFSELPSSATILLISCSTGAERDGLAQTIHDKTGLKVVAASRELSEYHIVDVPWRILLGSGFRYNPWQIALGDNLEDICIEYPASSPSICFHPSLMPQFLDLFIALAPSVFFVSKLLAPMTNRLVGFVANR